MNKKAEQLFSDLNDGKDFLVKDPELREIMINYIIFMGMSITMVTLILN